MAILILNIMPQQVQEKGLDNNPTFDYRDYIYPYSFTERMKVGDIFYYITNKIYSNNIDKFKLIITNKRHKSCNTCSLLKYHCEGLDCNIEAKKVIHLNKTI